LGGCGTIIPTIGYALSQFALNLDKGILAVLILILSSWLIFCIVLLPVGLMELFAIVIYFLWAKPIVEKTNSLQLETQ